MAYIFLYLCKKKESYFTVCIKKKIRPRLNFTQYLVCKQYLGTKFVLRALYFLHVIPSCANQRPFISLRIKHKWFSLASKVHSASGSFFGNPYQHKSLTPCRLESGIQFKKSEEYSFLYSYHFPIENIPHFVLLSYNPA